MLEIFWDLCFRPLLIIMMIIAPYTAQFPYAFSIALHRNSKEIIIQVHTIKNEEPSHEETWENKNVFCLILKHDGPLVVLIGSKIGKR